MSYYCEINFKKIEPGKVSAFLTEYKKAVIEHLKDIAKDNFGYVPYLRTREFKSLGAPMSRTEWRALPEEERRKILPYNFYNVDPMDIELAQYWARSSVFSHRYYFDEKHSLLCMFGVHESVQYMFDGTVCFQNSSDQDYKREEWAGIPEFEAIWDKWNAKSAEEMKSWYTERGQEWYWKDWEKELSELGPEESEEAQKILSYAARTSAYTEIWENYERIFEDESQSVFISLFGPYDAQTVRCFLNLCHEADINWRYECDRDYFDMLCGNRPEMQKYIERMCKAPLNISQEIEKFFATHPNFFTLFPEMQAKYDTYLADHTEVEQEVTD